MNGKQNKPMHEKENNQLVQSAPSRLYTSALGLISEMTQHNAISNDLKGVEAIKEEYDRNTDAVHEMLSQRELRLLS